MAERNPGTPENKRILYRIGINLGDVLIEGEGILGDGVNIAARLEGICESGGILISGAAYDHVRGKIGADFVDLGDQDLKNIVRPVRVYALNTGTEGPAPAPSPSEPNRQRPPRLSVVVLPFANFGDDPQQKHFVDGVTESLTTDLSRIRSAVVIARNTAFTFKGKAARREDDRPRIKRPLCPRRQRSAGRKPHACQRAAHRRRNGQPSLGRAAR
jgi:hypothetical protein